MPKVTFFSILTICLIIFGIAYADEAKNKFSDADYIKWLEKQSMLYNADLYARGIAANRMKQRPYIDPQTDKITREASVWFNAYAGAILTKQNQNTLQFLGSRDFWNMLSDIGFQVLYTGPLELAGGIREKEYTPTVDGNFDRIKLEINPIYGSDDDYIALAKMAKHYGAMVAGDIIPGHTGLGADFLLAERNYGDYPNIYEMVSIDKADWNFLPQVKDIWRSENLSPAQVRVLAQKNYIPGDLQRLFFTGKSTKPLTGWNATAPILGVDGQTRRFVYVHYFRPEQPTMNWLSPSEAPARIINGDIIKNITILGNTILRIDCNAFLNLERNPESKDFIAWSEKTPVAANVTERLAWQIRKLGGYSFQELLTDFDWMHDFMQNGPDLTYDLITRPAVEHAILARDASFLRFMMNMEKNAGLKPNSFVHAMQSHDEILYVMFYLITHPERLYKYYGQKLTGKKLNDSILNEMYRLAAGPDAPYNHASYNGLATTFVGLVASSLVVKDIYSLTPQEKDNIKKGHLLLAMFNAMQPGIFEISGWDMVGALPLEKEKIKDLLADGDNRWFNRGAYDLMGYMEKGIPLKSKIPPAKCLYGSLPAQLKDPDSFASQIRNLLKIRKQYGLAYADQIYLPNVRNKGAVIMVHKLKGVSRYEITALNFGKENIEEKIDLHMISEIKIDLGSKKVINLIANKVDSVISAQRVIDINLRPLQGKILYFSG